MRKWNAMIVLVFLVLLVAGGVMGNQIGKEEEKSGTVNESACEKIVMLVPGEEPENWTSVQEEMNMIFRQEADVEVEIIFEELDLLKNTASRMLVGNQQLDLMVAAGAGSFQQFLTAGQVVELDELLAENGEEILALTEPELLNECSVKGKIYGIPSQLNYGITENCWILNKDILERNGIAPEDITGMEQLESVFEKIHQKEPDITIVQTMDSGMLSNLKYFADDAVMPFGVLLEGEEEYINLFTSSYYRENVERVYRWFHRGYMSMSGADMYMDLHEEMTNGSMLAYPVQGIPGVLEKEREKCQGADFLCMVSLGETVKPGEYGSKAPWVITTNTVDEKKAMEVLRLLYVNEELITLLPEESFGGIRNIGQQALREELQTFNAACQEMPDTGFCFDITNVYGEYLECVEVYSKYKSLLESGVVEVADALKELNKELEQAGINKVIREKNIQYRKFLRKK